MNAQSCRLATNALIAASVTLAAALVATAQSPAPTSGTSKPQSQAEINAEREKIWNSSDMLRARAWLQDYCSKSAKVTPEMAKAYQTELQNMSPTQLKLWLLKFDEQEEQRQQQYQMFQQANTAGLQQAMAAHKQTQQAYSALNQASTAAAQGEQADINAQRANAQSNAENKQIDQQTPYGYYGGPYGGAFGGYGPYGGGVQYHYHLYQ